MQSSLNFANCDMVGHTGVIPAAIKAVEVVDDCVGEVYEKVAELGGTMLITADMVMLKNFLMKKVTHSQHILQTMYL